MNDNTPNNPLLNQQSKDSQFDLIKHEFAFENSVDDATIIAEDEQIRTQLSDTLERVENKFPVEAFPQAIQDIIAATNSKLNFPIDFIGASILFAISVAIGNTFRVELKNGFQKGVNIYLAIVGHAGTTKTHPLNFALKPVYTHDSKTIREYEKQMVNYEKYNSMSKKQRTEEGMDEIIKPICIKTLLSDYTPEALAETHKNNKRGLGVHVDELNGWIKNFDRYNNGSEQEFWNSVWSGMPINIDRKTGGSVHVSIPCISVAGTIQNGLLKELASNNRNNNGFMDRILFVFPNDVKKDYWSEDDIDITHIENWNNIINNILKLPFRLDEYDNPAPEILRFSPEAKTALYDWQKLNADLINEESDDRLRGIYNKLEDNVLRIALILEIMNRICDGKDIKSIGLESINGAIKLIEYFKYNAIKVHDYISNTNPLDRFPDHQQDLYDALPESFKTEEGLQLIKQFDVSERGFYRFLKNKELFKRIKKGEYQKCI